MSDSSADADEVKAALASVRVAGYLVSFTDPFGGQIALRRAGSGLQHLGGVAVRGPMSPPPSAFHDHAVSIPAGRAFEFVASWFGSPFDAANVRQRPGAVLNWGFWNFSGRRLARALAECKRQSPDLFAALLRRYGIDVVLLTPQDRDALRRDEGGDALIDARRGGEAPPAAGGAWELVVDEGRSERAVGRDAARLVASDARRLAALARAGRDQGMQLAQIDAALQLDVGPALAVSWPTQQGGASAGEMLRTARDLAALLFLVLRFGLRAAGSLVRAAMMSTEQDGSATSRVEALAAALWQAGQERHAQQMMQILASPELDD